MGVVVVVVDSVMLRSMGGTLGIRGMLCSYVICLVAVLLPGCANDDCCCLGCFMSPVVPVSLPLPSSSILSRHQQLNHKFWHEAGIRKLRAVAQNLWDVPTCEALGTWGHK